MLEQYFLALVVGVFLCCFGLYEKIVDSILHFFKDIKNNLKFILPIAIGTFIGIFLFGNILKIAFDKFYMETAFAFIGLILRKFKTSYKTGKYKKSNILTCAVFTFNIFF